MTDDTLPSLTERELMRIRDMPELWPAPTVERPDMEQIEEWVFDSVCEATDGCEVEPDGICPHGHVSWLIRLGLL